MRKQKKQAKILPRILAIALVLLAIELLWLLFMIFGSGQFANGNTKTTTEVSHQEAQESLPAEPNETVEETMPWEKTDAKQPIEYSWEEYRSLTDEQKKAFQDHLGTDGFESWQEYVQDQIVEKPWDEPGAKQPADYTWEEFEALTAAQQMAFQNQLGAEGFAEWIDRTQQPTQPEEMPWDAPNAKQPTDYTWDEYEALTAAQQMAFQQYLGTKGFEDWLNKVQEKPAENPWEKPGAKQPVDYTWAEFESLTAAQQMAFQNYLGEEGFEAWLNRVQNQTEKNPWEEAGAKRPEDYTWEEFEALTGAQQIAFQNYLGEEGFEAWLNRVLGL